MFIYSITNIINGKQYIGKTIKSLQDRWIGHYNDAISGRLDTHFSRAIRKYGKDNFVVEKIEECSSNDELSNKEKFWISELNTFSNGYNSTEGGDGGIPGFNHSEKTKQKISNSRKGMFFSKEHKKALSKAHKGLHTGSKNGMYGKKGVKNHRYGIPRSDEVKKKISESKKVKINQYSLDGYYINTFDSLKEAAKFVGGQHPNISKCCNGIRNKAYGYRWSYVS